MQRDQASLGWYAGKGALEGDPQEGLGVLGWCRRARWVSMSLFWYETFPGTAVYTVYGSSVADVDTHALLGIWELGTR